METSTEERRGRDGSTRVWYFTDLHGSTLAYAKLTAVAKQAIEGNFCDAIVLGGDLCGNSVVPVVAEPGGWKLLVDGRPFWASTEDELAHELAVLAMSGHYPYACLEEEAHSITTDQHRYFEVLDRLAEERVRDWLSQLNAELPAVSTSTFKLIVNTGTSDPPAVDTLLSADSSVFFAEDAVCELREGVHVASTAYREWLSDEEPTSAIARRRKLSRPEMRDKLKHLVDRVPNLSRCIFNFHVPPYGTLVDQLPHRPTFPVPDQHSGSKKIRQAIELHEPPVSLHGYAHDARATHPLGATLCINPGTEYYRGRLPGVIVEISASGRAEHSFTEDPLSEAAYDMEDQIFWQTVLEVIKNIPIVGLPVKLAHVIRKAIDDVSRGSR